MHRTLDLSFARSECTIKMTIVINRDEINFEIILENYLNDFIYLHGQTSKLVHFFLGSALSPLCNRILPVYNNDK